MIHRILYICFLTISLSLQAQKHTCKGIITSSGETIAMATVQLKGNQELKGAISDRDGAFTIENIPSGTYVLRVSHVGYKTYEKSLSIGDQDKKMLHITLEEDVLNLDQVVVSGTRYGRERSESPVIVNVIKSENFQASQSMALSEGISYQPGVRVETNCQNCGFTQVRLNGLEGGYSQILINSRPVFSALNSVYGLDQIPTNIIERVEIVRSGGSALYGSNAIAGTINIITRDPIMNTWQVSGNLGSINGTSPDRTLNANGSWVSDDLMKGITVYGMVRDRDSYDANEDGFTELVQLENNTLGAKAFLRPNKRSKITLDINAIKEYRRGGDRLDLAPEFTDITEELEHRTIFSGATYDLYSKDEQTKYSLYLSSQYTQRDSYYGGLGGGRTAADSLLASNAYGDTEDLALVGGIQVSREFKTGDMLVVGIENQYSDVKDNIPGYQRVIDQQVQSLGVFGQYEWKPWDRFTALLGVRYDLTQVDGIYQVGDILREVSVNTNVLSPRLTLMYNFTPDIQFRGGYARGFRASQAFNEDLHISSVGGEPQFVILSEELDKEVSDAFTASVSLTKYLGNTEASLLIEGFYTQLNNPFTIVSTGSVLSNGSILEEVRNGTGAQVYGSNFELSVAPSPKILLQAGGTWQTSTYKDDQVLYEPENGNVEDPIITTSEFVRNPNIYGYLAYNWTPNDHWVFDVTGNFTGSMIVPRVINESGLLDLVDSQSFWDMNIKISHRIQLKKDINLEISTGVQNIFDSFQSDFDIGPTRDSDYIYGPARPRTYFFGVKIGNIP